MKLLMKSWDQWLIALTGAPAIFLTQLGDATLLPYACLLGLAGQVGWFNATLKARQYGMFWTCFLYTWAWLIGFWNYWVVA